MGRRHKERPENKREQAIMSIDMQNYTEFGKTSDAVIPQSSVATGFRLIVDIGASDPRGTIKILAQTGDGQKLFEKRDGHVNDSIDGFESNEDFTNRLSEIILDCCKAAISKIGTLDLSDEQRKKEEKLSGLAVFFPGTIIGNEAIMIANLKNKTKQSLSNIDLSEVVTNLKNNKDSVKLSRDFRFVPAKDLAGTGIALGKLLASSEEYKDRFDHPENYKDRFSAVGIMTGGGFGAVDIKVVSNKYTIIETSESSHNLSVDPVTKTLTRIGRLGASKDGVIEHFAEKMGYSCKEDLKILCRTGNARIATDEVLTLDEEKHSPAIELLLSKGDYKLKDTKNNEVTLELNKESKDTLKRFKQARNYTINEYAETIAQFAVSKINEGVNLVILTGPLAMGLNKTVKQNPEDFGTDSLSGIVLSKIDFYVGDDNTINALRKAHNFNVVCDERFALKDNTIGGPALLDDRTGSFKNMEELLFIPTKDLRS